MKQIFKDNYIILTGAMGAGKSTVMQVLKKRGYTCVEEPARIILAEQRAKNGNGLPEADAELFTNLMLEKMKSEYITHMNDTDLVFFDRGFADLVGYADLFNIGSAWFKNAAKEYRFNKHVFIFNGWEAIYMTDDERKMSFASADKFGIELKKIYEDHGYILHDVPNTTAEDRTEYIIDIVSKLDL